MPKVINISPNTEVEEIDYYTQDEDYKKEVFSAYCLTMTERWKHKKYILTVLVPDIMTDKHKYNIMATHLYNTLIMAEDTFTCIDFNKEDMMYVMEQSWNVEYQDRKKQDTIVLG